jgi:hypothetical protein
VREAVAVGDVAAVGREELADVIGHRAGMTVKNVSIHAHSFLYIHWLCT